MEQTWAQTKHQEKKLAVAQQSVERLLLNIMKEGKIRNEVIRSKSRVKDIIERVRCMRGQWAGHVARISNTRWTEIISEWTPREGKQVRGRPKRRWRDNIKKDGTPVNGWEWLKIEVRAVSCWVWTSLTKVPRKNTAKTNGTAAKCPRLSS